MTENEFQNFMKDMLVRVDKKVGEHGEQLAEIKASLRNLVTKEDCQKTREPSSKGGISWVAGNRKVFIPLAAIAAVGAAIAAVVQAL